MKLGLFDTIGLVASLMFAVPVANFGANRILDGEPFLGALLVAVAILMVVIPQYLTSPGRILRKLALGLLPRPFRPKEENGE